MPAKVELNIEQLLVKLASIEVLLSLPQELQKDYRREAVRLGADPVDVPDEDLDHCFVQIELNGLSGGRGADSLDEAQYELFELGHALCH